MEYIIAIIHKLSVQLSSSYYIIRTFNEKKACLMCSYTILPVTRWILYLGYALVGSYGVFK